MLKKLFKLIVTILAGLCVFIGNNGYTLANASNNISISYSLSSEVSLGDPTTINFCIENTTEEFIDSIHFYVTSNYFIENLSYEKYGSSDLINYLYCSCAYDTSDSFSYYYEINYGIDKDLAKSNYSSLILEDGKFCSMTFTIYSASFYKNLELSISGLEITNKDGNVIEEDLYNTEDAIIIENINGITCEDENDPYNLITTGYGIYFKTNSSTKKNAENSIDFYFKDCDKKGANTISFFLLTNYEIKNLRYSNYGYTSYYKYLTNDCTLVGEKEENDYIYDVSIIIDTIVGGIDSTFKNGKFCTLYYTIDEDIDYLTFDIDEPLISFGQYEYNDINIDYASTKVQVVEPSSDILLGKIEVNGENATYKEDNIYTYITNDYLKSEASLYITFNDNTGKVKSVIVNSTLIEKAGAKYFIPLGNPGTDTTCYITTVAEDNTTTKEYELIITRAKSTNNGLKSLSISQSGSSVEPKLYNEGGTSLQSFSTNIKNYTICVSESVEELILTPTLLDLTSTMYIKGVEVTSGENYKISSNLFYSTLDIEIISQSGDSNKYTFKFSILNDNTDIQSIVVTDNTGINIPMMVIGDTYSSSQIASTITSFNVVATANYSKTSVSYSPSNSYTFTQKISEVGTIYVTLTSESGIERVYTIKVTRKSLSDDTDMSIVVTGLDDGVTYQLSNSSTSEMYVYELPKSAGKAVISVTAKNTSTTVTGGGTYDIPCSDIYVTATAENGEKQQIEIAIVSAKDTINTIYSLKLLDDENGNEIVDVDGNKLTYLENTTSYSLTLPFTYNYVYIEVTSSEQANITGSKLNLLKVGENTFVVYATSEIGVKGKEYTITIYRQDPSHDATLSSIKIDDVEIEGFTSDVIEYTLYVDRTKTSIDISATLTDSKSFIQSGIGNHTLNLGKNEVSINVIAQDSSNTTYLLTLIRAERLNTISNISIKCESKTIDFEFNTSTYSYDIEVNNSISNITINVTYNGKYGNVYGVGDKNLTLGDNIISVYVISESGEKGIVYSFNIFRKNANTDTDLSKLEVLVNGENAITSFNKDINRYSIKVGENVTSIYISAECENELSHVQGTGEISLTDYTGSLDSGNVIILTLTVTSESNDTKIYYLNLSRDSVDLSNDNRIYSIIVRGSDGNVYFNKEYNSSIYSYNIDVPFNVTSVYVDANSYASVNGCDFYTLAGGQDKKVEIYAISLNGDKGQTYTLIIHRDSTQEATMLSYINIDDSLISNFSSETNSYTINVDNNVNNIKLSIGLCNEKATYTIVVNGNELNNENLDLVEGDNYITITVFADSTTYKVYNLDIKRAYAKENLSSLEVENYNLLDEKGDVVLFDANIYTYYLNVNYEVNKINVNASVNNNNFSIFISNTSALSVGKNIVIIKVVSNSNSDIYTSYVINVTRKNKTTSDVSVQSFTIDEIDSFSSEFDNSVNTYNLDVASNIDSLNISLTFEGYEDVEAPSYRVIGGQVLSFGNNTIVVIVTSSDKTNTAVFNLNVTRKNVVLLNPNIKEIEAFASDYSSTLNYYTYQVEKSVTNLNISFDKDNDGTKVVIGNTKLSEGRNEIEVDVYSNNKLVRTINLVVYRSDSSNSMGMGPVYLAIIIVTSLVVVGIVIVFIVRSNGDGKTRKLQTGSKIKKSKKK